MNLKMPLIKKSLNHTPALLEKVFDNFSTRLEECFFEEGYHL